MAAISGYMVVHEHISALQSEPEQAAPAALRQTTVLSCYWRNSLK